MLNDLRYAVRNLARKPLFASVAIVTLALGIGANAAIFTVVNAVLLRPLPYPEPRQLMMVWTYNPQQGFDKDVATYPNFDDWRRESRTFERMSAYAGGSVTLTGSGDPAQIRASFVTPEFFETMGVAPEIGRAFEAREASAGAERVAVLSDGLWRRRFGGDRSIVGRNVTLNGAGYQVVGVMPQGFAHPEDAELWAPLAPTGAFAGLFPSRGSFWLTVVGRLKPGVSRVTAQAEMDGIASRLREKYPENAGQGVRLVSLHDEIVGDVRPALLVLLGAVCLVLLIACANVANLLLTRAASRHKELAIRAALGAGRARIVRQMLTESLVLSTLGGGAGLLLAAWGVELLQRLAPSSVPRLALVAIDARVLGYTIAASLATGVLFGIMPAFQGAASAAHEFLKEGGRSGTEGSRGRRVRSVVAMAELAVALVLLIGAGLLVRSFIAINRVDLGFRPSSVLALRIELPQQKYQEPARTSAFYEQLTARLASLPGVERAAAGTSILLSRLPASATISVEGRPPLPQGATNVPVPFDSVTPGYFGTLGIPLVRGRLITDGDTPQSQRVVVVNESFATRFFSGDDALGRRVTFDDPSQPDARWSTIVGVVRDTRRGGLDRPAWAELYFPHRQRPDRRMHVLVRTAGNPTAVARAAQAEVWALDRDQPVTSVRTIDELLARSEANRRFTGLLLGLFAAVALTLAAIGLYAVIAYSTAQRTHEIGVRMALGAASSDVMRLVLGEGVAMAAAGVALGLAGAAALTKLMAGLLFGVTARDPVTFGAGAALLMGVAVLASYIPARRAMRVEPIAALRAE